MGNRAVLKFRDTNYNEVEELPSIYMHWNGGRASVEGFLDAAIKLEFRNDSYGVARLCQVIGNFFGGNISLGVSKEPFNCGDNGIYIIENFKITDRLEYFDGKEYKYTEKEEINKEKTKLISDFVVDLMGRIDVLRGGMNEEEKYQ